MYPDNGSNLFISGEPDSRWDDADLRNQPQIIGNNLEAMDTSSLYVDPNSGQTKLAP